MPLETETQPSSSSPSLLQRFKRFQTRTAVKLDQNRLVYGAFGFTAISDARNIISWSFDVSTGPDAVASDRMHDWLISPVGIAVATVETLFLVSFAVLGSYFDETHSNRIIRFLALVWPYLRDSLKAIKNGYKGARSLIAIAVTFGAAAALMFNIFLPLALVFGALYLMNRVWYRHMCFQRKKMQTMNEQLRKWPTLTQEERLAAIKKNSFLNEILETLVKNQTISGMTDDIPLDHLLALINRQNVTAKVKGYLSSGLNGAFDGFYMYAGLYLLCMLVPTLAIIVNAIALCFVVLSILRNVYEEYCFQRKLELSAYKAEYKLLLACLTLTEEQQARLKLVEQKLEKLTYFSFIHAGGEAIRDGLGVYCVLTGILFAVSIFTAIPFPVVLAVIAAGIVSLLVCAGYNFWRTHQYHVRLEKVKKENELQAFEKKPLPEMTENKQPDQTELGRAALSGFKQGGKQSSFLLNSLQEKSADGHYQSSPVIMIVTCILGAIISVIYFLRALAKGFGRDKDELNLPSPSSAEQLGSPPLSPSSPPSSSSARRGRRRSSQVVTFSAPPSLKPTSSSDSTTDQMLSALGMNTTELKEPPHVWKRSAPFFKENRHRPHSKNPSFSAIQLRV